MAKASKPRAKPTSTESRAALDRALHYRPDSEGWEPLEYMRGHLARLERRASDVLESNGVDATPGATVRADIDFDPVGQAAVVLYHARRARAALDAGDLEAGLVESTHAEEWYGIYFSHEVAEPAAIRREDRGRSARGGKARARKIESERPRREAEDAKIVAVGRRRQQGPEGEYLSRRDISEYVANDLGFSFHRVYKLLRKHLPKKVVR